MLLLASTTLFYLLSLTSAASPGDPCNLQHNALQAGTYQFISDCGAQNFCGPDGICVKKTCRKDDFPFGYSQDSHGIPDKCKRGFFCPDEGDVCIAVQEPGKTCQLNRDDQCMGPDNYFELADQSSRGLNFNGSVCLNNVCMWANVTLGQTCVVENTAYIAYGTDGEFVDIVSRGNCRIGLYCDSQQLVCMGSKQLGETCAADKECDSWNCSNDGYCKKAAGSASHVSRGVYALVALGIPAGIIGTLVSLFMIHRRHRDQEREKRLQYWREQNTFHQNIMQMRDTAQASVFSLPNQGNVSARNTVYSRDSYLDESQASMLHGANARSNSLKHQVSYEDGSSDEDPVSAVRRHQSQSRR